MCILTNNDFVRCGGKVGNSGRGDRSSSSLTSADSTEELGGTGNGGNGSVLAVVSSELVELNSRSEPVSLGNKRSDTLFVASMSMLVVDVRRRGSVE